MKWNWEFSSEWLGKLRKTLGKFYSISFLFLSWSECQIEKVWLNAIFGFFHLPTFFILKSPNKEPFFIWDFSFLSGVLLKILLQLTRFNQKSMLYVSFVILFDSAGIRRKRSLKTLKGLRQNNFLKLCRCILTEKCLFDWKFNFHSRGYQHHLPTHSPKADYCLN